ncbi:MAG: hypothetical protein E3K37_16755 [Candidatus Kuenenia sp.]|nr:hypothetical protein [Candidatus Kuenenia hertensis]
MIHSTEFPTGSSMSVNHESSTDSIAGTGNALFQDIIHRELESQASQTISTSSSQPTETDNTTLTQLERNNFSVRTASESIKKKKNSLSFKEQLKMYKEDQLLSKPGGDYITLNKETNTIDYNSDQSKFSKRIEKDLQDAGENFINIFKDMGLGAPFKYVDSNGSLQEGEKVGFFGTIINFFKDIASGLTFGKYTPEGESVSTNALGATKHFFKKIFVDAVFKDIVVGIPRSAIHVGENAMFASINLLETIPDATIGNFKAGQIVTTAIFDNTQVLADFVTDVIPMGEANSRTHAFAFTEGLKGLPFIRNITHLEQQPNDENWKYVRNTPFRKSIETFATIIPIRM